MRAALKSLPSRLDAALASWPQWFSVDAKELRPKVLKALVGGLSNRAYLIQCASHTLVLRLNHPRPAALGINRQAEAVILKAIAPLNISPALIFSAPDDSFSVFEYIHGRVWQEHDFMHADQRRRLKQVVDQYRCCQLALPGFDYALYMANYWQQFQRRYPARAGSVARHWYLFFRRLRLFQRRRHTRQLVHHDLVPGNIIDTGDGLKIIDWEYAGLGFSALDDAVIDRSYRNCIADISAAKKNRRQKKRGRHFLIIEEQYQSTARRDHKKNAIINEMLVWLDFLWWEIR